LKTNASVVSLRVDFIDKLPGIQFKKINCKVFSVKLQSGLLGKLPKPDPALEHYIHREQLTCRLSIMWRSYLQEVRQKGIKSPVPSTTNCRPRWQFVREKETHETDFCHSHCIQGATTHSTE